MDVDEIAASLNKNEKTILIEIENSPKFLSDISKATGIDKTALLNSARKLLDQGLVRIVTEASVAYSLTDNGKTYLKTGLPEHVIIREMLKNKSTNYSALNRVLKPDELSAGVGQLKKAGVVFEPNGRFDIDEKKIEAIASKNDILEKISSGKEIIEDDNLRDLIKRKIIEKTLSQSEKVEIDNDGKRVIKSQKFSKELIDKLTTGIILDWRDKEFRRYSLDTRPPVPPFGKKHITKQFISHIKNVLVSMGFEEMQSNYIESAFWNFDVMMFKQNHPDRDIQDTVYVNSGSAKIPTGLLDNVKDVYESGFYRGKNDKSIGYDRKFDTEKSKVLIMRGHTTATTFRYIYDKISKNKEVPAKYFSVSKVFRNETSDPTHLPEFYQIEGIVYDDGITVANLVSFIKEFYARIGISGIRLKPTYNPYTEPSLEIQAFSKSRKEWVEVGNSGVFRPETLYPFGIKKNIIAWGFGLERALAMRLGINDIRSLYGALTDLDLLRNMEGRRLLEDFD